MLGVVYMGAATFMDVPEMALSDDEAQEFAKATVPVLDQFNFIPDPKYAAIFSFLIVAGKINMPRYYFFRERMKEKAEEKRANAARPIN